MEEKEKEQISYKSLYKKLISGAVAGVIGTLVIYPLDIIKTTLQTSNHASISECAKSINSKAGIFGFYRGINPNLVGIIPEKAIKLAVNDLTREFLGKRLNIDHEFLPIRYGLLAGATAGFCQVIITNPMEIVKIQMQTSKIPITPTQIIQRLSLKGLYKGTTATLMRDVPFSMIFFSLVSVFKSFGTNEGERTPLNVVFASGITAGAVSAALVTPMDVVKTKLQMHPEPGGVVYRGQLDCYKAILKNEGLGGLFKGVVPRTMIVAGWVINKHIDGLNKPHQIEVTLCLEQDNDNVSRLLVSQNGNGKYLKAQDEPNPKE